MDYIYRDQFYRPKSIDLQLLDTEIEAGNINAALIKTFLHISRFGLEGIHVGFDHAFDCIDAFLRRFPKEKSNPAAMMALGLTQLIGSYEDEAVKLRKVNGIMTPSLLDALLKFADTGSYFGRLIGSWALARGYGGELDYTRARDLLEKSSGIPSDINNEIAQSPSDDLDPTVCYELALTYSALAEKEDKKQYSDAEKLVFYRRSFLLALTAANLESASAQQSLAEVYIQREDDSPYFGEILDQNMRYSRAENLFERALNQGAFAAKTGLAHIYEATNRIDRAKTLYRELAEGNNSDALYDLILLHHRLGEYSQADECMVNLADWKASTNRAYNGTLELLLEYTVREGKPGLERSDPDALKVVELLLRRNRRRTITLTPPQIADLDSKARLLWERAWFRDRQKGLRRANRGNFPFYPVQIRMQSEVDKWNRELAAFEKSADNILTSEKAGLFVFVPADSPAALALLIAEAQKPRAIISKDLATALFTGGRFLINDPKNLRCLERADDIARNASALVLLPDEPSQQHAALLAAATADGVTASASLANELARLAESPDETNHWQRRAAERGSLADMRVFIDRYYSGDATTSPNWVEALQWVRRSLAIPPGLGGLKAGARREVEAVETTILAEKTSVPPRLWISDNNGLRPITRKDANLEAVIVVPATDDDALAWYVATAEAGSTLAAQIAVNLYAQRNELNHVWIMDSRLGGLRNFTVGDDVSQAIFIPRDPVAAHSFLDARRAEAEAREAAAAAEEAQRNAAANSATRSEDEALNSNPDPVEEDPVDILVQLVEGAHAGSVSDALAAGEMFHSFGYEDDALVMYEIAVGSGSSGALEVAERYLGIKPGAAKDIELSFTLFQQLSEIRDSLNGANTTRLNALREAVLEEAWVETSGQVLRRVRHGVEEDLADAPDETLLVLPPNDESLQRLFGQMYISFDAAAEAALRLSGGIGVAQDLNRSFGILSDLLVNHKELPPQDSNFTHTLPLNSSKHPELQQEWERQTLLLVEAGELDDGSMEYVMPHSPAGSEPIIIPEAHVAHFRILIANGRLQALSRSPV